MKKILTTLAVTAGLLAAGLAAPATAQAGAHVSFPTISDRTVSYGGTSTVYAKVTRHYGTKIVSKSVTAKRGSTLIARNRSSIALSAGTYRVYTKVKFKVRKADGSWGKKRFKMNTQTVVVHTKAAPKPKVTRSYYANCTEAREAGVTPLYRGDPGYASHLDRDGDGVACE